MDDHNTIVDLEDVLKASQAEVARLRAGLTYIATQDAFTLRDSNGHRWRHWCDIARRVLDGKEPNE
jgi:hypothetical protein